MVRLEEFVIYKNQKLFLDIYLPQLGIVIEVHGRQHDEFVKHFHKDGKGFKMSRQRDFLKEEWAAVNNLTFVVLREKDLPVSPESLLEHITDALNQ